MNETANTENGLVFILQSTINETIIVRYGSVWFITINLDLNTHKCMSEKIVA